MFSKLYALIIDRKSIIIWGLCTLNNEEAYLEGPIKSLFVNDAGEALSLGPVGSQCGTDHDVSVLLIFVYEHETRFVAMRQRVSQSLDKWRRLSITNAAAASLLVFVRPTSQEKLRCHRVEEWNRDVLVLYRPDDLTTLDFIGHLSRYSAVANKEDAASS